MNIQNRLTLKWIVLTFVLLPVLVLLGLFMRTIQSNYLPEYQAWFYPVMTLHGVSMAGLWYVGSIACASAVLSHHVKIDPFIDRFAFAGTVIGVLLLLMSILGGRFGAGWYFLYPLPFHGTWPVWATQLFFASLTVLAVSWLIWCLSLLRAIAKKFSLAQALGWHYIRGGHEPQLPPSVLISTVSLVCSVACLGAGAITVLLFAYEMATGMRNDALLMKNITFFFGHLLVNLAMYFGVAAVYELFPVYCGRPWKTTRAVAIAWNVVLILVLVAYFHHLYMDFAQPNTAQYLGQIASYLSAIPSAMVTIFGALLLVYHGKMKWNLTSIFFFLGLMGWSIGGIGALIDSTIMVNVKFHNTLWVPAHFHTYTIMGLVLFVLVAFYHFCQLIVHVPEKPRLQKLIYFCFLVGGYGFLLMFYLAGANSIPRRYAIYPAELNRGTTMAQLGLVFGCLLLTGIVLYIWETGRRLMNAWLVKPSD